MLRLETRARLLKIAGVALSLYVVAFVAVTRSHRLFALVENKPLRGHERFTQYGDTYYLCMVDRFRRLHTQMDSPSEPDIRWAEMIFVGDSFAGHSFDAPNLPSTLQERLGERVFVASPADPLNKATHANPLLYLRAIDYPPGESRILIWEMTERFMLPTHRAFSLPDPPDAKAYWAQAQARDKARTQGWGWPRVRDLIFNNEDLPFFVQNTVLTDWMFRAVCNYRFEAFGITNAVAPKYSLDPPMLFFRDSVDADNRPLADRKLPMLADKIAAVRRGLKEEFNLEMIFLPVPCKYTVYRPDSEPYSGFLPAMMRELRDRGVPVADVYSAYMESVRQDPDAMLYPADGTHWSPLGKDIAARVTLEEIRRVKGEARLGEME